MKGNSVNNIFVLTGPQGVGKSKFVEDNELDLNTISPDIIRKVFLQPSVDENGNNIYNNENNSFIFKRFLEILEHRMFTGGLIIIDATNVEASDYKKFIELKNKYDYNLHVVQFPIPSTEELITLNKKRKNSQIVPEKPLLRTLEKAQNRIYNNFLEDIENVFSPEEAAKYINKTKEELMVDLSDYKNIYHIGDIQGCYPIMKEALDKIDFPNKNNFYVFVGDYIDRGPKNAQVMDFIDKYKSLDNVVLLRGNHELHLDRYNSTGKTVSYEFKNKTLPQLHQSSFIKNKLKDFLPYLSDFFIYKHGERKVFVSHAGLIGLPEKPLILSRVAYTNGSKHFNFPVDSAFEENNEKNWYQIHGHRNPEKRYTAINKRSFPLEIEVEFGGYLPILNIEHNNITQKNYPNNFFKVEKDNTNINTIFNDKVKENREHNLINRLRSSDLIKEIDLGDNISSFNFTKNAFFKKEFSEKDTCKARGLFINTKTNNIVARGYEKFFILNEKGVDGCSIDDMKNSFQGRINCYEKANGYLGLSGYIKENDSLFLRCKSGIYSDFVKNYHSIIDEKLNDDQKEYLKYYLRKNNASATFEVIDPIFDPHIVEYDSRELVLLDIIKRQEEYERFSFEETVALSKDLGITTNKERFLSFKNNSEFLKFYENFSQMCPIDMKQQYKNEGYVVEDENGNLMKIKSPYYDYWKSLRGVKDKIARRMIKHEKNKSVDIPLAENLISNHFLITSDKAKDIGIKFVNKVLDTYSPEKALEKDIISLRNEFSYIIEENKKSNKNKAKLLK